MAIAEKLTKIAEDMQNAAAQWADGDWLPQAHQMPALSPIQCQHNK